jgi:hypothetical protein
MVPGVGTTIQGDFPSVGKPVAMMWRQYIPPSHVAMESQYPGGLSIRCSGISPHNLGCYFGCFKLTETLIASSFPPALIVR